MRTITKLVVAAALVAGSVGIAAADDAAPDNVKRWQPIYGSATSSDNPGQPLYAAPTSPRQYGRYRWHEPMNDGVYTNGYAG